MAGSHPDTSMAVRAAPLVLMLPDVASHALGDLRELLLRDSHGSPNSLSSAEVAAHGRRKRLAIRIGHLDRADRFLVPLGVVVMVDLNDHPILQSTERPADSKHRLLTLRT